MRASAVARLEAWFGRRCAPLNTPGAWRKAAWLAPLVFGCVSLLLGQDDGWDMKNYHLYNAYAALHGRIGFDLAPGQWQSYFNPTLDILYYLLVTHLPGPVAGFIMGALHGLNFILVLAIAGQVLDRLGPADRWRVPLLLAIGGMCSVGFLSEVGNSMGDNMTSLLVLAPVWLLLRGWDLLHAPRGGNALALGAGLLMGLGAGLKLTNATYAVGLCVALFAIGVPWLARLRLAFLFGVAVLGGLAVTAGWWFLTMWREFGNPLFPQFNNIFRSPLAQTHGVIDFYHTPQTIWEALTWPIFFTLHFERVSELIFRQLIWPVVYLLFIAFAVRLLWRRGAAALPAPRERFLLVFFVVAFVAWTKLFGVHRYLVPIELLAPLVAWLLLHRLLPAAGARRAAGWVLVVCSLIVFPFGTWGHTDWTRQSLRADVPTFAQPDQTVLVTGLAHPPLGWMVAFFPPEVKVVALAGGFPETPAWVARIRKALDERRGPHYAMVQGAIDEQKDRLAARLAWADRLGLTRDDSGCRRLDWLTKKVRLRVQLAPPMAGEGRACTLVSQPKYVMDVAAENAATVARVGQNLAHYGLSIQAGACRTYNAYIGAEAKPYLLCPLEKTQLLP
ncbi:glycosyltransferase 87 family protein [Pseudoduganella plicata]|uniref:DUF2029 domain-containing protein n=1 Tax=Pseudoduganella plicata TaxID=321984 RepID=A0A4P7BH47_9BURK|nr:glycosyltransferase 87 family protein [Pseudoduganella plicata]QBQ38121.1 DUF2029 domain-containing protein [Pseudoduganella plicata]GGZ02777.1 hypothetical protein GCM10007388_40500 [Pseudoduganella plicata]